MPRILVDEDNQKIAVPIFINKNKSKIQIKSRSHSNDYGLPVATRRDGFTMDSYVEWMIGYDVKWGSVKRGGCKVKITSQKELQKLEESTLVNNPHFIGANGSVKALYELSEYIYYFYKWGCIPRQKLLDVQNYLDLIDHDQLIDNNLLLQIERSHPISRTINDINFEYTQVKYPLLIYKFNDSYRIMTEIKISEKQYAIGIQPMLYLCFPITKLRVEGDPLVGRVALKNEVAFFDINNDNIFVFLEILKIFGILSSAHKHDVTQIIKVILNN